MKREGKNKSLLFDYLSVDHDIRGGKGTIQEAFIGELACILYEHGYENINYDHIKPVVPKDKSVPLETTDGRCDMVVGLGERMYARIEIEVYKLSQ